MGNLEEEKGTEENPYTRDEATAIGIDVDKAEAEEVEESPEEGAEEPV